MIVFLRNLIFRDFWLKFFSLVLAFLIWWTVYFAINKEMSPFTTLTGGAVGSSHYYHIPVLVMSAAADLRDFHIEPGDVEVVVSGEPKTLQKLKPGDIRVVVDLTGIEPTRGFRKRLDISTPPGVTLTEVVPDDVEIIVPPKR